MTETKKLTFEDYLPKFDWFEATSAGQGIIAVTDSHREAISFAGTHGEHLGSEGCDDLLLQLRDSELLTALKLGPNDIDEEALTKLCELLGSNGHILYFSLYSNALTSASIQPFAQLLSFNKTLVSVQLIDCKLNDEMASMLAYEFENTNRSVIQLDLANNLIGNEGAKAFARAIKVNDILTTLGLKSNDIEDVGGQALAASLDANFTLANLDLELNKLSYNTLETISNNLLKNNKILFEAHIWSNQMAKEGPLRKAKICFVGRNNTGKSQLIKSLKSERFENDYIPTDGAKVTQVLTRLGGEAWYDSARLPVSDFAYQFFCRFVNIKLDKKVELLEATAEKEEPKRDIGFAALKKKGNRRGSVQQRRASVTAGKKPANPSPMGVAGDRFSTANRHSRRSSVAMSVLNAVLGEPGATNRRGSVKDVFAKVVHPFKRRLNTLLNDADYDFYGVKERKPGETGELFDVEKLDELYDVHVCAKSRTERDTMAFNLLELSGHRGFYTLHHAFLTKDAVYVLTFNAAKLSSTVKEDRLEEIKYLNYWLKVIRYHSPDAALMVVGTHSGQVPKEKLGDIESDISKLVFPELHRAHAQKKQQLQLSKAVEAANEFAKELEKEGEGEFVHKKTKLVVNEKDRRLFFSVELSTGDGVTNVREALDFAAQKQKYFGQKVPVRWLKFLDALRRDSPQYFCTPERVEALAFQCLPNHKEEMKSALELFHELGYIVHLTEIPQLQNTVITDTLSFYRVAFRLIFTPEFSLFDQNEAERDGFQTDLELYFKRGLVSTTFLDYLWTLDVKNKTSPENAENVRKGKNFFNEYCQLMLVTAKFSFEGKNADKFIVPSMIPYDNALVQETKEKYGVGLNLKCKYQFGGYLTLGVFERLLCLCIQYAGTQPNSLEPICAMGWAQISFGDAFVFVMERLPDDILFTVIESKKKKAYKLVTNLEKMFGRLREILGKGFMWTTTLENGVDSNDFIPYNEAKELKISGWFA